MTNLPIFKHTQPIQYTTPTQNSTTNIHLPNQFTLLSHTLLNPTDNLLSITVTPYHYTYPPNHNFPNPIPSLPSIHPSITPQPILQLLLTQTTTLIFPLTTPIFNSNNKPIPPTKWHHINNTPYINFPNLTLNLSIDPQHQSLLINSIHFITPQNTTPNNP